jgi:hypothetical protein
MALVHEGGWDPEFGRRSAWLWPVARASARLRGCDDWPSLAQLDALYEELAGTRPGAAPLRFAPDLRTRRRGTPPRDEDRYDGQIALSATVPTRARNWHDLLNALCFASWPRSKRALHARQFAALQRRAGHERAGVRTPEQDALTLFDEGGVVVGTLAGDAPSVHAALSQGELSVIAVLERQGRACVAPFGHALFEHLVAGLPCPGASARVIALDALSHDADAVLDALDAALAREFGQRERFLAVGESAHLRLQALERARAAAIAR